MIMCHVIFKARKLFDFTGFAPELTYLGRAERLPNEASDGGADATQRLTGCAS